MSGNRKSSLVTVGPSQCHTNSATPCDQIIYVKAAHIFANKCSMKHTKCTRNPNAFSAWNGPNVLKFWNIKMKFIKMLKWVLMCVLYSPSWSRCYCTERGWPPLWRNIWTRLGSHQNNCMRMQFDISGRLPVRYWISLHFSFAINNSDKMHGFACKVLLYCWVHGGNWFFRAKNEAMANMSNIIG